MITPGDPQGPSALPVRDTGGFVDVGTVPLWIEVPDRSLHAPVTSLSPHAVRAVLPPGCGWEPEDGETLRAVVLQEADEAHTYTRACVAGHVRHAGATVVEIAVDPDRPVGLLWALRDRVRTGAVSFGTKPPAGWRPPKVPARGTYSDAARIERLAWITDQSGADTAAIRETSLDAASLTGTVESFVSGVEVPVGLAGPLWFDGEEATGLITAPFATTEGSLVASATRGATAITRSGGVTTRVVRQRMVRAPVFTFDDSPSAARFVRWVTDHVDLLRREVTTVSNWVHLVGVDPVEIGSQVHLRFLYETGDAAGQNMTTTCTWRACQWISANLLTLGLPSGRMLIEANVSGDKKANHLSFQGERGIRVIAECTVDETTLRDVLKVTAEDMVAGIATFTAGTFQVGALGFNINVANAVAAIFTATGQDIACVHESSLGILTLEARDGGIHATMTLPALIVGTVGGGTGLPRQRSFLDLMGCAGAGKVRRLAEIVCGYALALDLSTLAAIVSGQFAGAHERLGRDKPVDWFTRADLDAGFLEPMLREFFHDPSLTVTGITEESSADLGSSIITELTAQKALRKFVGFVPLRVDLERAAGASRSAGSLDLMVKSKPLGDEVALTMNQMAMWCGGDVATEFSRWHRYLGFNETHVKELHLAAETDPRITRIVPTVYGIHRDPAREAYLLVSEDFRGDVLLRDTADDVSGWELPHLETALSDMARAHAVWLGRTDGLAAAGWMGPVPNAGLATEMIPLWHALADHAADEFPEWFGTDRSKQLRALIDDIPHWWPGLEDLPHTLVHNDFNPRNICLRSDAATPTGYRLLAYDWELATLHVPQRDMAELLAFTLTAPVDPALVDTLVEIARRSLEEASGTSLDPATWRRGYALALKDFVVQRLSLYLMAHTFRDYRFLGRVLATSRDLLDIERERAGGHDPGGRR